uniref:(northern house mosquito) hypothetical protein n=1 Tax=Culex pipiens TaxID=7175 RepID=A0A8D7ZW35_CULPI
MYADADPDQKVPQQRNHHKPSAPPAKSGGGVIAANLPRRQNPVQVWPPAADPNRPGQPVPTLRIRVGKLQDQIQAGQPPAHNAAEEGAPRGAKAKVCPLPGDHSDPGLAAATGGSQWFAPTSGAAHPRSHSQQRTVDGHCWRAVEQQQFAGRWIGHCDGDGHGGCNDGGGGRGRPKPPARGGGRYRRVRCLLSHSK